MLAIIHQFELRRRNVANRFKKPAFVEPINPNEGGVLDLVEIAPGATVMDDLGFVESDDGFGERVVVRVADATDRRLDACFLQPLRVPDREVLRSPGRCDALRLWLQNGPRAPVPVHPGPGLCASSGPLATR